MAIFQERPANPKLGDTHTQPINGAVWEFRKFIGKGGKTYRGWINVDPGRPLTDDEFRQAQAELWGRLGMSPSQHDNAVQHAAKVRAGRVRKATLNKHYRGI